MCRIPLLRAAGAVIVALGLAALAAADPPASAKDDAANKRILYPVKHGSAKDLAAVLSEHFKGVAEVQASPDASGNYLLISAPAPAFDDVVKVLAQLDRPSQTVSLEIMIASAAARGDKPADDIDEKSLNGTTADVEAKLRDLQSKGVLSEVKRLQLTVVEGQPTKLMLGESKPYVTGMTVTATGLTSRRIQYRDVGTQINATVHVSPDKTAAVDLKLEDSRMVFPEDGVPIGKDENGKPVLAADFILTTVTSKLDVPLGQARAAEGVKTEARAAKPHMIVVVAARATDADAKPEK
ncbi:MAG TPA: secretin N-terminal domain-containing protein [Gemmataceae bacterium]|nr:secretin N-terminal domain-containing protein [Gemmataceae bacterium]